MDDSPGEDLPEHCTHDWTGPEIELERGSSTSCAKCGMLAIEYDLLHGE